MHGQPYIGITGFMNADEVRSALKVLPYPSPRCLMVGVLASSKTLAGLTNKYPRRFPQVQSIAGIFVRHPNVLNLIHYSTDDRLSVCNQLRGLTELGGPCLHGFQLNMAWPDIDEITTYRKYHEEHCLMLQIGCRALAMVEDNPSKLSDRVRVYAGMINGILLDASGGKGTPLDRDKTCSFLRAIRERNSSIGLGVAGGLSPATLDLVEPLFAEFPDLNIDAEGQLRTPKDNLNLKVAQTYLSSVLRMLSKHALEN